VRIRDRMDLGLDEQEAMDLGLADPRIFAADTTCTDGSRERIRRWIAAGQPDADVRDVHYLGDAAIGDAVSQVLAAVPMPVRWYAVRNILWIGTGCSTAGWCSTGPAIPPADDRAIVALATADENIIAHELGHAWLAQVPRAEPVPPRQIREADRRAAAEVSSWGMTDRLVDRMVHHAELEERRADAAARCWGFHIDGRGPDRIRVLRAAELSNVEGATDEEAQDHDRVAEPR
jgi:hypothetical protein